MTVRIGFLGAGFITKIHGYLLAQSGVDHAVVAVHDPEAERAKAFAARTGARVVSEDELFACVDAVFVAAWTSQHPRLVARAAELGLGVFCEKPLAGYGRQSALGSASVRSFACTGHGRGCRMAL